MDHEIKCQHGGLASGRWEKLSLAEQMANIGSEVGRALNWRNKGNAAYCLSAVTRALELVDLSLACGASYPTLKELARLREALVDFFHGSNVYGSSEQLWRRYFDRFNYLARKQTLRPS